jgi:8-oxo-dGTP pyrophosphatase MutT (NUDIX family)
MTPLYTLTHPDVTTIDGVKLERQAVRAVVVHGNDVLLLYTRRYDDYSFPGGGLDAGETPEDGLVRELQEETGATGIRIGRYLGYGDEYRPPQRAGHDVLFMRSHFYICQADRILGNAAPEAYEVTNGMVPRWININEAIAHNESLLRDKPVNMGMSIHRETLMLRYVAVNVVASGPARE